MHPGSSSDLAGFEAVLCYLCQSDDADEFLLAEEDLTGKPGTFRFVRCRQCGLAYQNPRLDVATIKGYYDDEYIAHRKKTDWGPFTGLYNRAMTLHDRRKEAIVRRAMPLGPGTRVLDVGCAVGTFLTYLRERHGCQVAGVDFKDLRHYPGMEHIDFHCGLFYEQDLGAESFDLITMWHFLEHDYDPMRTIRKAGEILKKAGKLIIEVPRLDSATFWLYRERWPGLQAPQHTVLFDKKRFLRFLEKESWHIDAYYPYGAFPAYFYLFAGAAFKILKGRGLNLSRAVAPYFLGQAMAAPILLFERQLNLAMQTVVCSRP